MIPPHLFVGLLVALGACTGRSTPRSAPQPQAAGDADPSAAPSDTVAVAGQNEPGDSSGPRGYIGVITPGDSVEIAPKFSGEIELVHVRAGDRVNAGDTIATLNDRRAREDARITESELRSSRAALRQAQVDARESRRKLKQTRTLVEAGHAPRSGLDDAQFELARADASVSQASASVQTTATRLSQLKRQLLETEIKAPFSGTVAERYLDAGAVVSPGTRIVRLISGDVLWVKFAVPPDQIQKLKIGDRISAELETLSTPIDATIRQIAPEIDAAAHLVFVEAQLDAAPNIRQKIQTGTAAWVRPVKPPPIAPAG